MKTSEDRTGNFGPYIHPSAFQTRLLATQAEGKISGIYYDAYQRNPSPITSFSIYFCRKVVDSAKIDIPPQSLPYRYPPSIRGSPLGIFLSRVSLSDINEIKTCSVESRCTGMMITYTDGAQEILDQWYESLPSEQTVVYETENGIPLEKLHFHLSYENGSTVLRQVTLFPLSNNFNGTVKAFSYGVSAFMRYMAICQDTSIWWFLDSSDVILSQTDDDKSKNSTTCDDVLKTGRTTKNNKLQLTLNLGGKHTLGDRTVADLASRTPVSVVRVPSPEALKASCLWPPCHRETARHKDIELRHLPEYQP
ncbi:hypothetical protein EMPG_09989 [Blastomyces silverae]|uniref:Uncharacterized protein n=1 Tax=Blastomyces silverae TaxID=2060906 RepID=A0A0H1BAE8_9EURO|nr:hypothetical protein EMPG_09989 [Blastomyces silverae]